MMCLYPYYSVIVDIPNWYFWNGTYGKTYYCYLFKNEVGWPLSHNYERGSNYQYMPHEIEHFDKNQFFLELKRSNHLELVIENKKIMRRYLILKNPIYRNFYYTKYFKFLLYLYENKKELFYTIRDNNVGKDKLYETVRKIMVKEYEKDSDIVDLIFEDDSIYTDIKNFNKEFIMNFIEKNPESSSTEVYFKNEDEYQEWLRKKIKKSMSQRKVVNI